MSYIYGLHAGDGRVRYVGRTDRPLSTRLAEHKSRSREMTTDLHSWVQEIGPSTLQIILLEECAVEVAQEREWDWIDAIPHLVNGWRRDMPDWMRLKIAKSVENHLATNGHPRLGMTHTEEAKRKMSEAALGRTPWNKKEVS